MKSIRVIKSLLNFYLLNFLIIFVVACQPTFEKSPENNSHFKMKSSLRQEPQEDIANREQERPLWLQLQNLLLTNDSVKPQLGDHFPVRTVYNREAIVPPMCYTRTEGKNNPCYVCHQDSLPNRENVMNDRELQVEYSFSDLGQKNHWKNIFKDRIERIGKISDEEIIDWVETDNYSNLADRLKEEDFKGWVPDLDGLEKGALAFDQEGFAKDGSLWVAYNYKPFPSTFWPTNGSTDDVMIRLPKHYRQNLAGEYSADIYKANLAILEAQFKGIDKISSLPIDEQKVGVDLNQDGRLSKINEVTKIDKYVGQAEPFFIKSHLFPEGTEFLHTVRYLGFGAEKDIQVSKRMKEVRYMKKWKAYPKGTLARYYEEEAFAKEVGHLPGYTDLRDHGLDNGMGWSVQGFIENSKGNLRAATYEENLFCMGCHNSIGSTIDKTFSFARKVDGAEGWGYIDLKGMQDVPNVGEEKGEILTYFERVGGGDEFRSNTEMLERWFNEDGSVNKEKMEGKDVYALITPSYERALRLNKAYKILVDEQSFLFGRDAIISPLANVYENIENGKTPTLPEEFTYSWDIRLDWSKSQLSLKK